MATADVVNHFPQISLTDIIGYIFDDGFDADFHTETNMDVENLVVEVADYPCNDCNKDYKTKGGLRRHQKSKHQPSQKNIIDHLQLKGIIEKAAVKLSDDFCFVLMKVFEKHFLFLKSAQMNPQLYGIN